MVLGGANDQTINYNISFADATNDNLAISLWSYGKWFPNDCLFTAKQAVGGEESISFCTEPNAGAAGVRAFVRNSGGSIDCLINYNGWVNDTWTHWVINFNNTNNALELWKNNVKVGADTSCSDISIVQSWKTHNDRNGGNHFPGHIDDLTIFSDNLNQSGISQLYNGGAGSPYSASPPTGSEAALNITGTRPVPFSSFKTSSVNFNATVSSNETFNCSLYINGSLNQTGSGPQGDNITVNFTVTFGTEGYYTYNFNCSQAYDSDSTVNVSFWADMTSPTITTNFFNGSIFSTSNITGQFNFSDNIGLYSYNVSIDGNSIGGATGLNVTDYIYNLSVDPSTLSGGSHVLTVRIADGHTKKKISDYDWSNGIFDNYMKYIFPNEGIITTKLKNPSLNDKWTTEKQTDRYTQTLEPSHPSNTITLVEESTMPIYIQTTPGYYGGSWIITGNHWKDYVLENEPSSEVKIKRINDYKVEVTISGIYNNLNKLKFKSIGDLNVVTQNFTFAVINGTFTYNNPVFETDLQTMTFVINKTLGVNTSAVLVWNNTIKSTTKNIYPSFDRYTSTFRVPYVGDDNVNVTFRWDYNLSGVINTSSNVTDTQSVYRIALDNCDNYTATAINFSIFDESTSLPLVGTIHLALNTWRNYPAYYKNDSFDFTGQNNYSICINPAWTSYKTSSLAFEYLAAGYTTEDYTINNLNISSSTHQINLYLSPVNTTQNVIVTLLDTDYNKLEGYEVIVKRYYPESGTTIVTESTETNHDGNALVHLTLYNVYYSFEFKKDGVTIDTVAPAKYFSTSNTFVLDLKSLVTQFGEKVSYRVTPTSPVSPVNTKFNFEVVSEGGYIDFFAIDTIFGGAPYDSNISNPTGGNASLTFNLTGHSGWLLFNYSIKLVDEDLFTFQREYFINNYTSTGYSLEDQKASWEGVFPVMWRVIIAVIISIIAMLVFIPYIGTEASGIIAFVVQAWFVYWGWIPLWIGIVEGILVIGLYLVMPRGGV